MMADLNKARSEALANDFENHNLKREISDLKKSNLSLSNISMSSTKTATKNESTMTESQPHPQPQQNPYQHPQPHQQPLQPTQPHHITKITIPIIEKKKEVMFNLGEPSHRLSSSQTQVTQAPQASTMQQKLSRDPLIIRGCSKTK